MSVIWVTEEEPYPTSKAVLAEYLVRRAMDDPAARATCEACYANLVEECGAQLRDVLAQAKSKWWVDPGWVDDPTELPTRISDCFKPWCESWGGFSEHIFGATVVEAILRFYGIPRREATRTDRESILAALGLECDEGLEVLLDTESPRPKRGARKDAREMARTKLSQWQRKRLTKWADLWWQVRVVPRTSSIKTFVELQGIHETNFYSEINQWDQAAGYRMNETGQGQEHMSNEAKPMCL